LVEESILTDDFLRELINVGEVDILVGLPTYNDAKTVGSVVQTVRAGLLRYFPRQRAVVVNADGGSRDGTQELVRAVSISDMRHVSNLYALRTLHCISTQYSREGNGGALHTILGAAELLRATSLVVVSPESTTMEPEWIERLVRPVAKENFDLISPIYRRHKFDALLVRTLVYPMTRAMYGKRLREPYPIDFAFSGRLATQFLGQDPGTQAIPQGGAEMQLSLAAMSGDFRVGQSFLGTKERVEHGSAELVPALRRTVGILFSSLENFAAWSTIKESLPVPTIGVEHEVSLEPLRVNRKRLYQMFVSGVAELEPVLKSILSPDTLAQLQAVAQQPEESCRYPDELWVETVYEFAASHHKAVISRDHIIQALAPLYRGKALTFVGENREASAEQVEKNVEALCLTFESLKPYLLELWDGGK
jgi:glucosylglycerate synthase